MVAGKDIDAILEKRKQLDCLYSLRRAETSKPSFHSRGQEDATYSRLKTLREVPTISADGSKEAEMGRSLENALEN